LPRVADNVLRQNQHFMPKGSFTHASQPSAGRRCHQVRLRSRRYRVFGDTTRQRQSRKAKRQMRRRLGLGRSERSPRRRPNSFINSRQIREGPANRPIRNRTRGARVEPSRFDRQSIPWYYCEAPAIYRKLKRHSDEIALIRRLANNHNIHFRVVLKRYRSTRAAAYA
jgi:hypothetical protein